MRPDDPAVVEEVHLERPVSDPGPARHEHLVVEARRVHLVLDEADDRLEVHELGRGDEHLLARLDERKGAAPHLDRQRLADRPGTLVDLLRVGAPPPDPLVGPRSEAARRHDVELLAVDLVGVGALHRVGITVLVQVSRPGEGSALPTGEVVFDGRVVPEELRGVQA